MHLIVFVLQAQECGQVFQKSSEHVMEACMVPVGGVVHVIEGRRGYSGVFEWQQNILYSTKFKFPANSQPSI